MQPRGCDRGPYVRRDRIGLEECIQLSLAMVRFRIRALDGAELLLTKAELVKRLRHQTQLLREHGAGIGGPHLLEALEKLVLSGLHGRHLPFQLLDRAHEVAQLVAGIVTSLDELGDGTRTDQL